MIRLAASLIGAFGFGAISGISYNKSKVNVLIKQATKLEKERIIDRINGTAHLNMEMLNFERQSDSGAHMWDTIGKSITEIEKNRKNTLDIINEVSGYSTTQYKSLSLYGKPMK
jgi:hypothetical protein